MSGESIAEQIGRAWRYEREGQPDNAIAEYERILKLDSNNIDAYFGLGLAQRVAGKLDEALASFRKSLELVETADRNNRAARDTSSAQTAAERVQAKEHDDRYMMLRRMLTQRIAETEAGIRAR
jgi:tetratricopeptide (TPR) repeat protein